MTNTNNSDSANSGKAANLMDRQAESEKVHAVLGICEKLTAKCELDTVLKLISTEGKGLVHADRVSVFLLDPKKQELWSAPTPDVGSIRFDAGLGLAGMALRTGRVLNVPDAYRDSRFYRDIDRRTGYRTGSVLALPLKNPSGRVIGVCEALNKEAGAFTADDVHVLQLLGPIAANVIGTARYIGKLQTVAGVNDAYEPVAVGGVSPGPPTIGESQALSEVLNLARRYAPHDITVLITGETGTGKELLARYIHDRSSRSAKPFVACNLASVPESLLESELFGYVKGSFTGASKDKKGLLDEATGGTLFLDEIGDIPHSMQVKLLRFLENREYHRVGEPLPRPANVRLIAATNKELDEGLEDGSFRKDLFYRLNHARLILPPLRERPEDILHLAQHFVDQTCAAMGKIRFEIGPALQTILTGYPWPGNIRELRNVMENSVLLADSGNLEIANLPSQLQRHAVENRVQIAYRVQRSLDETQKELIQTTLEKMNGNRARTAEFLGISTRTLYRKMRQLDLT